MQHTSCLTLRMWAICKIHIPSVKNEIKNVKSLAGVFMENKFYCLMKKARLNPQGSMINFPNAAFSLSFSIMFYEKALFV